MGEFWKTQEICNLLDTRILNIDSNDNWGQSWYLSFLNWHFAITQRHKNNFYVKGVNFDLNYLSYFQIDWSNFGFLFRGLGVDIFGNFWPFFYSKLKTRVAQVSKMVLWSKITYFFEGLENRKYDAWFSDFAHFCPTIWPLSKKNGFWGGPNVNYKPPNCLKTCSYRSYRRSWKF